jgi:hypothetical protein
MAPVWVVLTYGSSVILALLLLYLFHSRSWYWHASSVGLAIVIGLTPVPAGWQAPTTDLLIGSVFLLLLVWGLAAPLFRILEAGK